MTSRRDLYAAGEAFGECCTQRRLDGRYLCGGGGKSTQKSDQITTQTDNRVSGRDGAQVSGSDNTVTVHTSDYGAVLAGTELARNALTANTLATVAALDVFKGSTDSVAKAYDNARNTDQKTFTLAALAVVGVAGVAAFMGKK